MGKEAEEMSNGHEWVHYTDVHALLNKQISEFLKGLYKYREQIGFQKHYSLDLLIKEWEGKIK